MKQHRTILAVLSLAAVAAAALALSGTASSHAAATRTLRFTDLSRGDTMVDGAPRVGGRLIFADVLFNAAPQFGKPAGARVGSAEGVCTIVSDTKGQCTITAHVPDGEIVAMGAIVASDRPHVDRYGIVGGAGAYGSARGTVSARPLSPTRNLVVVQLGE